MSKQQSQSSRSLQSQSSRSLPKMIFDMTKDKNYERIMIEAFDKMDSDDFAGTVEQTCGEVLRELKQSYHLVDRFGESIDDSAALGSKWLLLVFTCLISLGLVSPSSSQFFPNYRIGVVHQKSALPIIKVQE